MKNTEAKTVTAPVDINVDVDGSLVFGGKKSPTSVTGMDLGHVPENLDPEIINQAKALVPYRYPSSEKLIAA